MTTKLKFLWVLLALLVGGVNGAWAAEETFNLSSVTSGYSYDQTQNNIRLVINRGSSSSYFHSGGNGYRLSNSGASLTITVPAGQAVTSLVLTCNNKGNYVEDMAGFTVTSNSDWNPFTGGKADSYAWSNSSNVANPITFTTKDSGTGDVYVASITVTTSSVTMQNSTAPTFSVASGTVSPGTVTITAATGATIYYSTDGWDTTQEATTSVDVPITKSMTIRATAKEGLNYNTSSEVKATYYVPTTTWDFTQAWSTYSGDLSSDYWNTSSSPIEYKIQNTTATPAYVSAGVELPETYGLVFITNNNSNRLGYSKNNWIFINGSSSFVIPNLAAGLTVRVTASGHSGGTTMTPNNTTVTTTQNLTTSQTAYTYTVASTGNVSFAFGNQAYISKIEVLKTDINFGSLGGNTSAGIPNNKTTGLVTDADWNYMFTFRDVADASKIYQMSSDEWNNVTFTPDNTDVITIVSKGSLDGSGRGSIRIHPVASGTVDVNISFTGSDRYNAKTGTVTFTITKNTQTLSFAESSKVVNYGAAAPTNTLTQTPTQAEGGTTVTYSSSDTHVASVNESTGALTINNAGTCTITATAEENATYAGATASYTLTVNGTQTPVIAWKSQSGLTESGGLYTADNLPYGNSKSYTAQVTDAHGSGVDNSAIRYGVVEAYAGYLTVDDKKGTITPTRKFADDNNGTNTTVQVYAYIPGSGSRNPSNRIVYNVTITKGMMASTLFAQTELTVNAGCTIAPKNNVQSMPFADITAITVSVKTGNESTGVAGNTGTMISDYIAEANAGHKSDYFETAVKDDVEQLANFYPVFKGLAAGDVTFTVTVQSKTYGDLTGDFTLHVLAENADTPLAWASDVKTGHGENDGYTIYEGDYMLIPSITGNCNGNFQYSDGYQNANTHHKYLYTRRWAGSAYEFIYNNRNYKKGQGVPNYELCSDAAGTTVVDATTAGNEVALLFWNVGGSNDTDELLVYGNKAGTIYLRAKDSQKERQLETIKITVKSRTTIDDDFNSVTSAMTFPYTWDFTAETFANPTEEGNGYWTKGSDNSYSLGMQTNINYDYADYDKDGTTWGNTGSANTSPSELTTKPIVSSFSNDKVMRGFAGMQIRTGNNGTGSWYSKRDGIHIKPYTAGEPRLHINGGTHTFILPTPTGSNCPETFKVFVKARALEAGKGTLWVKAEGKNPQNGYYNFSGVELNQDIIYSVDAAKGQTLTLDVEKVDIYWIAFSTEAKPIYQPTSTTYPASTYSYTKALDLDKSTEVNTGLTTCYASGFNSSTNSVTMTSLTGRVEANSGLMLKLPESNDTNDDTPSSSCYMIADPENSESYSVPTTLNNVTNYLIATGNTSTTPKRFYPENTHDNTNFILTNTYHKILDNTENDKVTSISDAITDDWKYVRTAGDIEVGANKAYLRLPGRLLNINASARAMSESTADSRTVLNIVFDDDNDATKVQSLNTSSNADNSDDGWHTLQGVKVSTPTRGGLYIYKGKKIAVK